MLRVDPTNGENLLGMVILIAMQDAGGGRTAEGRASHCPSSVSQQERRGSLEKIQPNDRLAVRNDSSIPCEGCPNDLLTALKIV
jgi:hypothetical protein